MTTRRAFVGTLAGGLLAAPLVAGAQPTKRIYRLGYLQTNPRAQAEHLLKALEEGLRERGYVVGRDIVIEYRFADGKGDRLADLAAELVRLKVDIIVVWGTPSALAAKQATTTIPIVMASVGDPLGSELVASLARPGGNLTGLSSNAVETEAKRLELLKELMPKASRVGVFWNPTNSFSALALKQTQRAAQGLRIKVIDVRVRGTDDFPGAFATMTKERADALIVQPEVILLSHMTRILEFASRSRLPAVYGYREFIDAGGLMFYGPSWPDLFRRAAIYVDKILKGAAPGDLPVEQPTKFELVINLKTAKALGLTIPPSLLQRADEVIR
ncbi:MAG: ABC transporter substrate-binding protein [Isosphaeraceae bacterium]